MPVRSLKTRWPHPLLVFALLCTGMAGCGDSSTGPEAVLRPGRFRLIFEIVSSVTVPEPIRGRHEITFRMQEPGTAATDLQMVGSRRILDDGAVVEDYLVVDPSRTTIEPDRWILRFVYTDGAYSVGTTLLDQGGGSVSIVPGCVARQEDGPSYLAAGCRLDRL